MDNQLIIKIILIVLFVVFGIALILPAVGARRLAIRRILLLLATLAAVVAIAFPELVNGLANLVGVGRGTDLVLYVLVVVFIGNSISNSIRPLTSLVIVTPFQVFLTESAARIL